MDGPSSYEHMRRFGCLAWFMREPIKDLGKLEARWCRGVYLGPALASRSHLIGHYVLDDRTKEDHRFAVSTSADR